MSWLWTLLPYVLSVGVSLSLTAFVYGRRAVPAAIPLVAYLLGQVLWTLGYIAELLVEDLSAKLAWDSFQYVGMFAISIAVLVMVRTYVGKPIQASRGRWAALLIVPVAVTAATLTEPWHHRLRQSAHIVPSAPTGALWYDFTLPDYLGAAFLYGILVHSTWCLIVHLRGGTRLIRRQTLVLLVGLVVPALVDGVIVYGYNPFPQRDPAPLLFLVSGMVFAWGLFRVGLFELLPVARAVIFESIADGVVVVDPQGRLIDLNPAAANILGAIETGDLGRPLGALAKRVHLALPSTSDPNPVSEVQFRNDQRRWFETSAHLLTDANGSDRGWVYVLHDVTDAQCRVRELRVAQEELESKVLTRTAELSQEIEQRKQIEIALTKSERRFRAIFDQSFQQVGLLAPDGILIDANLSALALVGVELRDVVGLPYWTTPWWSHIPEEANRLRSAIQAAAQGVFVRYETTHRAADGALHVIDFSLKPVRDEADNVVMIIPEGRDITELRYSERERQNLTAQLHQSQRLEALGRLAGGVAHDFNNLLTVIAGNLSLIQSNDLSVTEQQSAISETIDAAQRASDLTRQLLTFSRRNVVEPCVFDATDCLNRLRKILLRVVGEDISLKVNVMGEPGTLFMDPSQFEQVLMNLVVNARDAMPSGGQLDVTLSRIEISDRDAQAKGPKRPGYYLLLTVSDTGTGIPDSIIDHLFEPFFTTKAPGVGTGLGLATVHGIVTQAMGTINVDSRPGWGTTFRVYIPSCDRVVPELRSSMPARSPETVPATIVVVEDQLSVRELVVRSLKRYGFHVHAYADARSALEFAKLPENEFALLLTDVVMPELGGRELADALRDIRPAVPILFMSGHTDDAVLRHGIEQANEHFIAKPFTPGSLAQKVQAVLDERGKDEDTAI